MGTEAERGDRIVGRDYNITNGMVIFFLIFLMVSVIVELFAGEPTLEGYDVAGWHPMVFVHLIAASAAAAVVYGIIVALVGRRLPGTWLGEAILVALVFYGIWIVLQVISDWGLTGTYAVRGLVYAIIAGVIGGILFALIERSQQRA